jgi:hypothetical protein
VVARQRAHLLERGGDLEAGGQPLSGHGAGTLGSRAQELRWSAGASAAQRRLGLRGAFLRAT